MNATEIDELFALADNVIEHLTDTPETVDAIARKANVSIPDADRALEWLTANRMATSTVYGYCEYSPWRERLAP